MNPNINEKYLVTTNLDELVSDYRDLIFDDRPVLWIGKNVTGNILVCSSISEDLKARLEWFFVAVVAEEELTAFLNGALSLRSIYQLVEKIYVVEQSFDNSTKRTFHLPFNEIDEAFKPSSKAIYRREMYE